eukprot:6462743-Pyramimonas_sp.AAC.1
MHEAARLSRQAARCRFGARHRDGRRLGITTLSKKAWLDVWQLEGGSGGVLATEVDWSEWRQQRDLRPVPQVQAWEVSEPTYRAAEDYAGLTPYFRKTTKRRAVPVGTTPAELWD